MEKVYARTNAIKKDMVSGFCPGCMHGTVHKLIGEVLEDLNIVDHTACVLGVGCCGLGMEYITYDNTTSPHGRACAVATGLKRTNPDTIVYTYQGDGDLASIGLAETMSAANRGENITVIFINNGIYGMTGGQMAPTTLVGQKTTTGPGGRCLEREGGPIHLSEIIATLGGVAYCARTAVNTIKNIAQTKRAIRRAFETQIKGEGFGFVEVLATCPTNWRMSSVAANERVGKEMIPEVPLGVFKDAAKEE